MKRFTLSLILVGLLAAACSAGASPTSTPTAIPTAVQATTTAAPPTSAPSPTPEAVTAAVAFDGKACTYTGPTDLPHGSQVTFSLVNTTAAHVGSIGGVLAVGATVDGTTREQVVTYMQTHPASVAPPFALDLGDINTLFPQLADKGETLTVTMKANLYTVYIATSPSESNKAYFCTLLKVFDR